MGYFRFRRSFRLFPGLRINLSKSGVSTSVGRRGLWFTIGPRGTRETIGIPGTGLSYTEQQPAQTTPAPAGPTLGRALLWIVIIAIGGFVLALTLT
jgi:hypothetical protein